MRVGTKSVLFGAHCFLIHPWFVARGWWKAYGAQRVRIGSVRHTARVPLGDSASYRVIVTHEVCYTSLRDWRLWVAFFVHDIGYLGKPNMDGPEGESHPVLGARIMYRLGGKHGQLWHDFVLLHSRYYAKALGRELSPLCLADKWAGYLEPAWLYLPRVQLSGELAEYMEVGASRATSADSNMTPEERAGISSRDPRKWHAAFKSYMARWIAANSDGGPDTWTKARYAGQVQRAD